MVFLVKVVLCPIVLAAQRCRFLFVAAVCHLLLQMRQSLALSPRCVLTEAVLQCAQSRDYHQGLVGL